MHFGPVERRNAQALVEMAMNEDLGDGRDLTTLATIPVSAQASGLLVARAPGVISGLPIVNLFLERCPGLRCEAFVADGEAVERGTALVRLQGDAQALVIHERALLNFLQRLSGIATLTARYVAAVAGTKAVVLDTRKTTPGWRALEKYAVRCGGGRNHRFGLHDAVLIKDNHLAWLAGQDDPIGRGLAAARASAPVGTVVEVEVDSLDQFDRALECAPDIILLDNFTNADLSEAVQRRDRSAPGILLEASGGVNLETIRAIAETGVDRISVGALTHSAPALDIALDFENIEEIDSARV